VSLCDGRQSNAPGRARKSEDPREYRQKTKRQLMSELAALRARVAELEASGGQEDSVGTAQVVEFPGTGGAPPPIRGRTRRGTSPQEERQRAYQHLRRQLDFTRAITDSLGDGVIAVDHEGHINFLNPAAKRMLGWSQAELLGRAITSVLPEEAQAENRPLTTVLATGATIHSDATDFLRKDGSVLTVSCVSTPIISDGRVIGGVVSFHDVTERVRMEAELRENELRFRGLYEQAAVGIALGTLEGHFMFVNPGYCKLIGRGREELLGLPFSSVTHPDDVPADQQSMVDLITGVLQHYRTEKRYVRPDGSITWAHISVSLVRGANDEPLYFITVAHDITERKRLEAERVELLQNERSARLVAEAASRRLEMLQSISDVALQQLGADDQMQAILARLGTVLGADHAAILAVSEDGQALTGYASWGTMVEETEPLRVPITEGVAGQIAATREAVIVNDLSQMTVVSRVLREQMSSLLGVALVAADQVVGVLYVARAAPHHFTEDDAQFVRLAADRIALALDHVRLHQSLQRARADAAMRAAELEAIFEAAADAIFVYDRDRLVLRANAAGRHIMTPEMLADPRGPRARAIARSFVPRDEQDRPLPPEQHPVERALRGGVTAGAEAVDMRFRLPDGHTRIFSVSAAPVYDASGTVSSAVAILRDVTERRRLERLAEERAAQLETIFETMADGVIVYDRDGNMLHTNAMDRQYYSKEIPGGSLPHTLAERRAYMLLYHVSGEPLTSEEYPAQRTLNGERFTGAQALDARLRLRDGRDLLISISGAPIRDEHGAIIGGVLVWRDVTERIQLEQRALRAATEATERASQLETLISAISDGVIVFDTEARVQLINDAARSLFGVPSEQALPRLPIWGRGAGLGLRDSTGEPLTPDQAPLARILRGETLTGSSATDIIQRRPGTQDVFLSLTGAPLRDAHGEIIGAVTVMRDVTEQRRLERELIARARERDDMFEAMADAVMLFDPELRPLYANATARRLFGLETLPAEGARSARDIEEVLSVRDEQGHRLPVAQWPIARLLRGEVLAGAGAADMRMRSRDGRELLLSVTGAPVYDGTGHLVAVVSIFRDVMERRALEQRTQQALHTMLAITELFASGAGAYEEEQVQSARVGQSVLELTRSLLGCRRAALLTVGPVGDTLYPLAVVGLTPEQEHLFAASVSGARLRDYFPNRTLIENLYAGETLIVAPSDLSFATGANAFEMRSVIVAPMRVDSQLLGVLAADFGPEPHDYTHGEVGLMQGVAKLSALMLERDRLLREREEARANELALREANRRMDEFLSIATHELNTPVSVLKLSQHLMAMHLGRILSAQAPADTRGMRRDLRVTAKVLHRAEQQLQRLQRLVDDLLDVSRIRVDRLELRKRNCDLLEITRTVVAEQRAMHLWRTITLVPPERPTVPIYADPVRIGQVVENYVTNALKYSSEDRPVEVGVELDTQTARVWVRDQGIGLTPEEQSGVWDRFQRVAGIEVQSGSGIGLGLGLYISRTIISQHAGRTGVTSQRGAGSTFWFELPLVEE
jgi:PAS domain S-box-containing protein